MSKEHEALARLFELLEARYAMRILWALADGHPQTFRLLQDSVGGVTPNTLNTRIKELRAAQLLDHCGTGYRITALGADLTRRLGEMRPLALRLQQQRGRSEAATALGASGGSRSQRMAA